MNNLSNIKRRHLIMYGCIAVSLFQAGMWVMADMPDKRQGWVIVFGIGLFLLGSHEFASRLIPMLAGITKTRWMILPVLVALVGIGFIEKFSISTSAAAFDGNMMQVTNAQNMDSPVRLQYKEEAGRYKEKIKKDEAEIEALRATKKGLPADHVQNRNEIDKDISALKYDIRKNEEKLMKANSKMNSTNTSINGKAFENLESGLLGMSQGEMALLFAILASLVPLITAFLDGAEKYLKEYNPSASRRGSVSPIGSAGGGTTSKKPSHNSRNVA